MKKLLLLAIAICLVSCSAQTTAVKYPIKTEKILAQGTTYSWKIAQLTFTYERPNINNNISESCVAFTFSFKGYVDTRGATKPPNGYIGIMKRSHLADLIASMRYLANSTDTFPDQYGWEGDYLIERKEGVDAILLSDCNGITIRLTKLSAKKLATEWENNLKYMEEWQSEITKDER